MLVTFVLSFCLVEMFLSFLIFGSDSGLCVLVSTILRAVSRSFSFFLIPPFFSVLSMKKNKQNKMVVVVVSCLTVPGCDGRLAALISLCI